MSNTEYRDEHGRRYETRVCAGCNGPAVAIRSFTKGLRCFSHELPTIGCDNTPEAIKEALRQAPTHI